ncbi:hypothetical protein Hamer_G000509 [Homarus americanus]|uniref:Uncharacterized protein n=1 Tax=Homarus americanus TaxID=6706 RepID=A0A8J5TLU7_HOMAM|nr:hypothetical protein Hamer_G000509 [Homarus americanus]
MVMSGRGVGEEMINGRVDWTEGEDRRLMGEDAVYGWWCVCMVDVGGVWLWCRAVCGGGCGIVVLRGECGVVTGGNGVWYGEAMCAGVWCVWLLSVMSCSYDGYVCLSMYVGYVCWHVGYV